MEPNETNKQKMIVFATSEHGLGAIELLKTCRTQLTSVLAEDEFHTLVNALTLEIESSLIQRVVIAIENIRSGNNLNEPK